MLSPEIIILGGGIAKAGDPLCLPMKDFIEAFEWQPLGITTPIIPAAFGELAGAMGAPGFAMEDKFTNRAEVGGFDQI